MENFYKKMRELEQKYDVKLIFDKSAFNVEDMPELPKPFRKGQVIDAEIVLPGRIGNEKLAVACESSTCLRERRASSRSTLSLTHLPQNRLISVPNCFKEIGSKVKLRIKRTKHNIFLGELLD
jgi:uncharacterized Fe-S cluster-containing radical SAM superfamily enzyme